MSFTPSPRSIRRAAGMAAAGLAVVTSAAAAPANASTTGGTTPPPRRDVSVNLFEWNWPSVAKECTSVLGPAGYGSVQVSPPQDSTRRTGLGDGSDTVLHPWWEVYQPVSYRLTSRMGTEQQFKDMVSTCRRAGVKVIVDTVINHMTGQGTTSYGYVPHTKYDYPGLYNRKSFHDNPSDCPVAPKAGSNDLQGSIADFNDYRQVFNCDLVGLSDLDTSQGWVRKQLAGYLNKLVSYGVSGFRVDAAKHIGQTDLAAITAMVNNTVDGTRPLFALEVMPGGPGRLAPKAFQRNGTLLGFDYAGQLQSAFHSYNNPPNTGNIGSLKDLGPESGLLPSDAELVFVQNHDTERNGSTLNYKDPNNVLAHLFMLAYPHGTPQVYSGFTFKTPDDSPPADSFGRITDTVCDGKTWTCLDRNPAVRALVGFHNIVGDAPVTNWWDNGANVIAFSRGDVGFFAANNTSRPSTITVKVGLPAGKYRDRVHGTVVTVDGQGNARMTIGSYDAVALTTADRA